MTESRSSFRNRIRQDTNSAAVSQASPPPPPTGQPPALPNGDRLRARDILKSVWADRRYLFSALWPFILLLALLSLVMNLYGIYYERTIEQAPIAAPETSPEEEAVPDLEKMKADLEKMNTQLDESMGDTALYSAILIGGFLLSLLLLVKIYVRTSARVLLGEAPPWQSDLLPNRRELSYMWVFIKLNVRVLLVTAFYWVLIGSVIGGILFISGAFALEDLLQLGSLATLAASAFDSAGLLLVFFAIGIFSVMFLIPTYFYMSYSMAMTAVVAGNRMTLSESSRATTGFRWRMVWLSFRLLLLFTILNIPVHIVYFILHLLCGEWLADVISEISLSCYYIVGAAMHTVVYKHLQLPISPSALRS